MYTHNITGKHNDDQLTQDTLPSRTVYQDTLLGCPDWRGLITHQIGTFMSTCSLKNRAIRKNKDLTRKNVEPAPSLEQFLSEKYCMLSYQNSDVVSNVEWERSVPSHQKVVHFDECREIGGMVAEQLGDVG